MRCSIASTTLLSRSCAVVASSRWQDGAALRRVFRHAIKMERRQRRDMFVDGHHLKCNRARIVEIEHHQIEHRGDRDARSYSASDR